MVQIFFMHYFGTFINSNLFMFNSLRLLVNVHVIFNFYDIGTFRI